MLIQCALFGITFMLTGLPTGANDIDCSRIACDIPLCKNGYYTPEEYCCPICRPEKPKPGTCPEPLGGSLCVEVCHSDNDCNGTQKCCSTDCGHTCQTPIQDCSNALCTVPKCDDFYTPTGACCPICPAACLLPKDPGPCFAAFIRYYYNTETCQCEPFTWGGCRPNENNFFSLLHCQNSCEIPLKSDPICELPKKISDPVCNLPSDTGLCAGAFQRFFFNIQTCQCEEFIYGGCGGNENRYETLQECRAVCGSSVMCPVCNLPAVKGTCEAKLERWYFDAAECKCKMFWYGGCSGNMNRFLTRKDCEGSCWTFPCPVCSEPKKVWPCKMAISRFYYDPLVNTCKEFTWGGCQPNGNNFRSKRSCDNVCQNFVCSLPAKVGPCKAAIERYYYDAGTGKCQTFLWGGCDSNGNNFRSFMDCKANCMHEN